MGEVIFSQTQLARLINAERRAKVLGSITPLAYLLRDRSRLSHAREHVATIDLKPSLSLQFLDHLSDFVLTLSEFFLQPSKQFIFFTFRKHQIIIGEISVLLFKLALQLVPRAFDLELVHKRLDA
jgi:hypothetical protein